jgi:uncharacterized protein (TIGR02265 family)
MSASQPGNTTAHRASLEICFAATDLKQRLGDIPRDAMCRGVFFNMLDDRAAALGHAVALEYRDFFRVPRLLAFRMYPVRDYLTRLVVLSQIAFGPDRIHAGLRELQSGAFDAWAGTMLGRAALAVANPSLPTLLRVLERAYAARTVVSYARFTVQSVSATEIVTAFEHEYVYIEHAMVGALEAVMRACGRNGSVVPELDGPYDGRVRLFLQPRVLE